MPEATVFSLTHFLPSVEGHGGTHRAYQVQHDATMEVGKTRFQLLSLPSWAHARSASGHHLLDWRRRKLRGLSRRLAYIRENPFKLFSTQTYANGIPFGANGSVDATFIDHYSDIVAQTRGPSVCILEHKMFSSAIEINSRFGIPTIAAFQNLEAFDIADINWSSRTSLYSVMTDLGNELRILERCSDRLVISKVEAGLIGGLGIPCEYYPYLPVGAIRERLRAIRRRRSGGEVESGLFVLLGTADHEGTRESMKWFVERAADEGLPDGICVVAAGLGTDRLLPGRRSVRGLELRGWVAQSELDALLARAAAAVIPQRLGFGALTRLPELACAGVPVLTFHHPSYAINPTPGLRPVGTDWCELRAVMRDWARCPAVVGDDAYERWEAEQPRPLAGVLRRLVASA
jgi:hypothetical protein